jgi:hypothetical protein
MSLIAWSGVTLSCRSARGVSGFTTGEPRSCFLLSQVQEISAGGDAKAALRDIKDAFRNEERLFSQRRVLTSVLTRDEHFFIFQVQEINAGGDAKAALRDMKDAVRALSRAVKRRER